MIRAETMKHHWRDHIEALTGAILIALAFKAFLIEISRIPSASMQPTLMGTPQLQVFDRVLVDKLSYHFRSPERWEIVVFKHPLERSRNMVKRLVGMPEEDLKIQYGDLWTRKDPTGNWSILRRPRAVQEEMWKAVGLGESSLSAWRTVEGKGWNLRGDSIAARGNGMARYRPGEESIDNGYLHGYPDGIRKELGVRTDRLEWRAVGDLRLSGSVVAHSECQEVWLELREGSKRYRFSIPGPAADANARVRILAWESSSDSSAAPPSPANGALQISEGPALRLEADESFDFAVQNLDDLLELELDEDWVCELEVDPVVEPRSSIYIGQVGSGADFDELLVERDIYYLNRGKSRVTIPSAHYFVLGDNTQDSADSRLWERSGYRWTDEWGAKREVLGNWRPGENPATSPDGRLFFRDVWGERHEIPDNAEELQNKENVGLVPELLIHGRALATFWPIKPSLDLYRVGWLH